MSRRIEIKEHKTQKNTDGHLGPICNNCAGFGFTLNVITGGSSGCNQCGQTGVEVMSNAELQTMVTALAQQITDVKNLIVKELENKDE